MKKHFLITATEQESSNYGVRFFGHFFENKKGIKITLFYTASRPPEEWDDKRTVESERQRKAQEKENQAKGQKALNGAKKILENLGFDSDQIFTKVQTRMLSRAGDIIQEGSTGSYDALVLGRRGLSWFEEAFDESVSKEIMDRKYDFPLWLCRMPDFERKNVLVCVDGSEPAFRIADHVGFVLQEEKRHRVTLLRIKRDPAAPQTTDIFDRAVKQMITNGLSENLIDTKEIEASDPAEAILEQAESGKYAAVAAGWTGRGKGVLERMFSGSNSYTLFRELKGAALLTCY
jgi:nucleotide-binding universal stress UspA family protein